MTGPRITLRIDRIVSDTPGLERAALAAAIRDEVGTVVARDGTGSLGTSRNMAFGKGVVQGGKAPLAQRVGRATVKVLGS
ncbi:hypothetical protein HW561_21005 [Rhodobacteraceae bacterium B1Z28]|uniref:TldD/PmbA family protein n=1 Tax=Ruegeria haliotis TaxID=2747601 RepID=A0ABX2PVQ8_9RHOB|nr:hypothetical protein [Ruegeria haliotis]NVO58269.1 hypothetical protein [Ruegeria haliotis]